MYKLQEEISYRRGGVSLPGLFYTIERILKKFVVGYPC